MKKVLSVLLMCFMVFSAMPIFTAYAEDVVYQENVIDKISDWAQTVGKDKEQRDQILAKNKAERQKKHMQKKAEQMEKKAQNEAKQAGKKAEKAKKDMKNKMGL